MSQQISAPGKATEEGSMNPKIWGSLSVVFVGLIAVGMEFIERDEFDPESLPPPAAGTTATTQTRHTCDGIIYSISEDNIKYVRESGGGTVLAAELDNKISFYQFGRYGSLQPVDHAEQDSETSKKLEYALTNCNEIHIPSGVNFAYR
jgi:hypothetical protein